MINFFKKSNSSNYKEKPSTINIEELHTKQVFKIIYNETQSANGIDNSLDGYRVTKIISHDEYILDYFLSDVAVCHKKSINIKEKPKDHIYIPLNQKVIAIKKKSLD